MKNCDLHTHTLHSDGTFTPTQLVDAAVEAGLSAIALTDHNTVGGLSEFLSVAEDRGIRAVAGVEFSTEYGAAELHVHGLFISPEHFDRVMDFIGDFKARKDESNRQLVKKLCELGFKLDYEKILAKTPDGYVNRAHIAAEMVANGYVKSFSEAFEGFLSEETGYYVPPRRRGVLETVDFIKSIGAVAVLAHPLLQLSEDELCEFLALAKDHGLDGMETEYSLYTPEQREASVIIAKKFGLLCSGGSDFHGDNKPGQNLGSGRGDLLVPYEMYEALYKRWTEGENEH